MIVRMDLGDMREFKYTIRDKRGFHARPAGFFVREAGAFPCSVRIVREGKALMARRFFSVRAWSEMRSGNCPGN